MAMVDYGAIVWKDGKLISTDMFTPMEDMVGWSDKDDDKEFKLDGNCFAYIGDKDFTVGFYKDVMRIHSIDKFYNETVYFGYEDFIGWRKWEKFYLVGKDNDEIEIIVRPRRHHDYYICTMTYRGHKYKVTFGYGVDLAYYKKTHIVDYYGTPWFKAKDLCRDIKYKIDDWRYRNGI